MSKDIEIEKDINAVTISVQVDYVKCKECGEELEFTLECDGWGDLQIEVEKCDCE